MKLTTREQIELFYSESCTGIQGINKEVSKLMSKNKKSKSLDVHAESLLERVKEECHHLKALIKANPEIEFTLAYERQFEDLCFR
jgi:hypothetical protein